MNAPAAARTLAVVALLVGSLVAAVGAASGAQPSISSVAVSPQEPLPGELVTFTTTIRNAEGADGSFEVESIWIRKAGTTTEYARVNDPGNVPPGSSLEVPLTTRFDEPGVKELRVRVNVVDEDDALAQLEYPVTVVVSERRTQLAVDVEDPVVGATSTVNVTVSNGGADPLRQLDLRLGGDGVTPENPRRLQARLESGTDRTFTYDVTFEETGRTDVEAVLRYASTSGQTQTVRQAAPVDVEPLRADVSLDARISERGGANPPLSVEVTNFGNAPLEDVSVRVTDGDRTVARRSVESIDASASRDVRVNLSGVEDAALDVTVAYETGGRAGEASATVRYASQPGRIEITGVDYSRDGDVITISGSASNVGLAEANSVVVRVVPTEGVEPAPPNRDYFVGTVPASDFVSFDLTARIEGDVSSVPVRVTYLAAGASHTEEVALPYESVRSPSGQSADGGGLGLLGSAVLLLAVVAVAAGGVVWWRRRDGGGE